MMSQQCYCLLLSACSGWLTFSSAYKAVHNFIPAQICPPDTCWKLPSPLHSPLSIRNLPSVSSIHFLNRKAIGNQFVVLLPVWAWTHLEKRVWRSHLKRVTDSAMSHECFPSKKKKEKKSNTILPFPLKHKCINGAFDQDYFSCRFASEHLQEDGLWIALSHGLGLPLTCLFTVALSCVWECVYMRYACIVSTCTGCECVWRKSDISAPYSMQHPRYVNDIQVYRNVCVHFAYNLCLGVFGRLACTH